MIFVIDGNSLLNVVLCATLYTTNDSELSRPFYNVNGTFVIKDAAEKYYRESILNYIYNCIAGFQNVERVIFAFDSNSWRKVFFKKYSEVFSSRPDYSVFKEGYKGQRKIDSEQKEQLIQMIRHMTSKVMPYVESKVSGFSCVSMKGLEGDDIIAHIVNTTDPSKEIVVWTNDSDMTQILRDNVYMIGSNDKKSNARKFFRIKEDITKQSSNGKLNFNLLNENMSGYHALDTLESLVSRGIYAETIVDPVYEVFTKILCGDKKSDNIPASYSMNKDGKIVNVTKVRVSDVIYKKLLEEGYTDDIILNKIDTLDASFIENVSCKILSIMNAPAEDLDIVKKGLSFNIHMIRLCENCIPKVLTEYIDERLKLTENQQFKSIELKNII